jgi:hypothetical protein
LKKLKSQPFRVYLAELPALTRQEIELFLDIESVPDQDFHYLIGLLVCQGDTVTYHSFWADTFEDEEATWQAFLIMANQYSMAPIYHYGSYEPRVISKLARRHATDTENLNKRMININKEIYAKVYFPVYSNRLKDIAGFIGATWTHPDASGLQSIVWRYQWEETREYRYKAMLLTYNEEDCRALKLIADELYKIQHTANTMTEVDFADRFKQRTTEVSEKVSSEFKEILRFAHFNYDKNKIRFRHDAGNRVSKLDKIEIRKLGSKKFHEKVSNIRQNIKSIVQVPYTKICPNCGYEPLAPTTTISKRFIVDLVITEIGVQKTMTEYNGVQSYCPKCCRYYAPIELAKFSRNQVYGHGFGAWVIFQRVALRLPYESIAISAFEQFGETFNLAQPQRFLVQFAEYYANTERQITEKMLASPFIHVDETKINIQGANWYVWVFTDGRQVILKLSETRETDVVQEFLAQYHGVLITDFYAGYDAIKCKQQRCWAHLIGDLNDDIREHPFDKEYETFVLEIRNLILPIMEAIQQYGLKKQHLHEFTKQVDDFYTRVILNKHYKSDLVCTYQKRFVHYRDSLFTFLDLDDIPWNNNAAERAIRPLAIQRDISKSPFHASAVRPYLVLLGICQTCRFQDKSFFKFLFSEKIDLEDFAVGTYRR